MFQEALNHAPVGTWIKSGALRYLVINNRAVLDMPGEYVCTQVRISWFESFMKIFQMSSKETPLMCPGSHPQGWGNSPRS